MKFCFVDYRISKNEENSLRKLGVEIIKIPKTNVYDAINGHPDIQMHIINNKIVVHKNIDENFLDILKQFNIPYTFSSYCLDIKYPGDIILNCISLNNHLIHNLKYTDQEILKNCINKKLINVSQGYTKCSTAVISETAFITSDIPIATALKKENFDVLIVPPGDIELPGLNYGFIGGTCGLIDKHTIAFFGSLDNYSFGDSVKSFLKKHNVKPIYLSSGKLIDRGSILTLTI